MSDKYKDYKAQVMVGISNINPRYVKGIYNEKTGKCGRPKKIKGLIEDNKVLNNKAIMEDKDNCLLSG